MHDKRYVVKCCMGAIGLMFVVSAILLFGIGIGLVKYAQVVVSHLIGKKHKAAEYIIHTGYVPPWWFRGPLRHRSVSFLTKRASIIRIGKIARYFRRTPFVDDESAREQLVTALINTRAEWRRQPFSQMVGPS